MLVRDRILVSLVVLVALVAAGRTTLRYLERRQASLEYGAVAARELRGEVLNADPEIGRAAFLSVLGNHLVVGARRSDSALYVVSTETGTLTGSAGAKGDGPGQFRAPASIVPAGDDAGGAWLFDVALSRLTRVDLRDDTPRMDTSTSALVQLPAKWLVSDLVRLQNGTLLTAGAFPEGRFAAFDRTGALAGFAGSLPPNPDGDSTEAIRVVYMGKLRAAPERPLLAVSAQYAGRLDIYHRDDWQARPARVPFAFEPQYAIVEGRRGLTFAPTRDTRYGYVDLAVTEQHIFGLFSGRTEISHPGRDNYAEYVHVFDWEGTFLGAYHLDEDVFAIAVDDAESTLYAARHLPEPAILVYQLDGLP